MSDEAFQNLVNEYKNQLMELYHSTPHINPVETETLYEERDPQNMEESYEEFLKNNAKQGTLKIQASIAKRSIPIENVDIIVSKNFKEGTEIFYRVKTDPDGIVDGLILPAPDKELSQQPSDIRPYATYDITATHPNYRPEKYQQVPIFAETKSIQPVNLVPTMNDQEGE